MNIVANCADLAMGIGRSVGVYNLTMGLLAELARRRERTTMRVLGNRFCKSDLPRGTTVCERNDVLRSKLHRVFWEQWRLAVEVSVARAEILFLPKGMSPFVRRPRTSVAAYVHDAMLEHYRRFHPQYFPWVDVHYTTRCYQSSLRTADVLFVNSEFTATELRRWSREIDAECRPIIVAGCGLDHLASINRSALEARRDQILLVTGEAPHKLAKMSIDLLDTWITAQGRTMDAVVLGRLPKDVSIPKCNGWRHLLGLSNASVSELMATSRVVVYASEYEGFGLPAVEAAILESPVVYSRIPALVEVMNGHGFSFVNGSQSDFDRAMQAAINVDQSTLLAGRNGLLEKHNWKRTGDRMIEGFAEHCSAGS